MKRLNYNHLLYFWTVAKLGSVSEASVELKVSQPTVSEQVRTLEKELGRKLFRRVGRKLVPTEFGRMVFRHCEKIFGAGRELTRMLEKRSRKPAKRNKAR